MTLKEKFIKYFGDFEKTKNSLHCKQYITKKIYDLELLKDREFIYIKRKNIILNLDDYYEDMTLKILEEEEFFEGGILQAVEIICNNIKHRNEIINLEKQMLYDLKHIPTSNNKILKF